MCILVAFVVAVDVVVAGVVVVVMGDVVVVVTGPGRVVVIDIVTSFVVAFELVAGRVVLVESGVFSVTFGAVVTSAFDVVCDGWTVMFARVSEPTDSKAARTHTVQRNMRVCNYLNPSKSHLSSSASCDQNHAS